MGKQLLISCRVAKLLLNIRDAAPSPISPCFPLLERPATKAGLGFLVPYENSLDSLEGTIPQGHRILVVDDELDLWWGIALKKLARAGYEVDTARDGEAAWQAMQTKDYDLLITDNKMPRLWGMELIEKVRSAQMELPVILVSSFLPQKELKQNAHLKIDGILEKPVSASELLGLLDRVLCVSCRVRVPSGVRGGFPTRPLPVSSNFPA